ncbi:MAG: acyl-CoA dehydrogenase family protein [Leptospirales bacterium]
MSKDIMDFSLSEDDVTILEMADEVCRNEIIPRRAEMDEKEIFPHEVFDKFREAGLFSVLYATEYGGLGSSSLVAAMMGETISKYCLGVGTAYLASKLGAFPIEIGGTEEQKMKYLTPLASGEKLGAFGLTEPDAGSDVPAMTTTAVKKGDAYILNGTKQWISNAGQADIYTVFAETDPSKGSRGFSCFILEKGMKGLSFGKLENKLGIRASHTAQIIMEDVEVPAENLVGLHEGKGFIHAIKTLNVSRPVVAGMAVGVARGAYDEAVKYTRERVQFGKSVINFQVVQHMLVDMLVKIEAGQLLVYRAARCADLHHSDLAKYSAIAKYYCSENAVSIANDALQLHGGYGYVKDYPVEKMYRDAKILTIYEGTSQIQKNEIATYILKQASRKR